MAVGAPLRSQRRRSPGKRSYAATRSLIPAARFSNRKCHELEMPVTPFLPSKAPFLIATAFDGRAQSARHFELPASSLYPPEPNHAPKELKFAVNPQKSITSIFLIAVAAQGKPPHCDPQSLEPGAPSRHKITSVAAFSSFQPLASSFQNLIDTNAIRNAANSIPPITNPISNRQKTGIFSLNPSRFHRKRLKSRAWRP